MKTMKRSIISFGIGKLCIAVACLALVTVVIACGDSNSSPVGPSSAPAVALPDDTASFSAFGRTVNSSASGSGSGSASAGSGSEGSTCSIGSTGSTGSVGSDCEEPFVCPSGSIGTPLRLRGFIQAVDGNSITVKEQSVEVVEGETELVSRIQGVTLTLEMLEVGLPVKVEAMICDGTATATRLVLLEEFEVTGVIFMIGSDGTDFTLMVEGLTEGLYFELAPDAEVDEALCVGDIVEVEARVTVTSNGFLFLAEKVELEASMSTDRTCSPTIQPTGHGS